MLNEDEQVNPKVNNKEWSCHW